MTGSGGEPAAPLPAAVRRLLAGHGLAEEPVRAAVLSSTRVDTGRWLRGEPVWVALVGDRLLLLAPGPRPFVRIFPAGAVARGGYNHVTGALALPAADGRAPAAAGSPRDTPSIHLDPLVARSLIATATAASSPSPGTGGDA